MKSHAKSHVRRTATRMEEGAILHPISVRIPVAVKLTGMSRSRIYELIKDQKIAIAKDGASTLIMFESLKSYIEDRRLG